MRTGLVMGCASCGSAAPPRVRFGQSDREHHARVRAAREEEQFPHRVKRDFQPLHSIRMARIATFRRIAAHHSLGSKKRRCIYCAHARRGAS